MPPPVQCATPVQGDISPPPIRVALLSSARADLLDLAIWRDGLEKFARATNLAVALVDTRGRLVGECLNSQPTWQLLQTKARSGPLPSERENGVECPFCLHSLDPCRCVADALAKGEMVMARDRAGLVHFAVPLRLKDHSLGALVAGQVFDNYPEQLALEQVARRLGLPAQAAWHLARQEHPVKQATLRVYGDLLASLGQTFLLTQYHTMIEAERLAEMTRLRNRAVEATTERVRIEESLRESTARLTFALETSELGDWDLDLITHSANRSLRHDQIFGYKTLLPEWTYAKFQEHVHPEDRAIVHAKFQDALAHHQDLEFEARIIWRTGETRWVWVRGSHYGDGTGPPSRMLGVVRDITDRKLAEEALKEADLRKDEFLAMLAHELRNPLAPIRNAVQVMREIDMDDPKAQWARDVVDRQVHKMTRLVDELLDVSRITRGKVTLEKGPLDLAVALTRAVEGVRPKIQERRQGLTVFLPSRPVYLNADLTRLEQVFDNLLNNAAKYTGEGGHIWLTASVEGPVVTRSADPPRRTAVENPDTSPIEARLYDLAAVVNPEETLTPISFVVISVRDDGMGIPSDMLPRVFDLFTQVDRSLSHSQGGLGIGLTLARRLVEMHGGTVEAKSAGAGLGSEFIVRLPVLPEGSVLEKVHVKKTGPSAPSVNRRILVVDDNEDSVHSLAVLLRTWGNEVETANDGSMALAMAPSFKPDVVLLDIGLPLMDGYEVARRLRQIAVMGETLLVALTGYGQEEDRRRSQEAGFDVHLVKPVDLDALRDLLAHPAVGFAGQ